MEGSDETGAMQRIQSNFGNCLSSVNNKQSNYQLGINGQMQNLSVIEGNNSNNSGNSSKRPSGIPPSHPHSHFVSPKIAPHQAGATQNLAMGPTHSRSLSQSSFFSFDNLPPLSPSMFRESSAPISATSDVSMEEKEGGFRGGGGVHVSEGLPPRKGHRRSNSDVSLGFASTGQASVPHFMSKEKEKDKGREKPAQLVLKREADWGGPANVAREGGGERKSEGEVVNDLLSAYMNFDNLDAFNSSSLDDKDMDSTASGTRTNDSSENEVESAIAGNSDGNSVGKRGKRNAPGDIVPTPRHFRSLSMDSFMGTLNFSDESPKLPPSPGIRSAHHSPSNSFDDNTNKFSLEFANGDFSPAEMKKIMASDKLAELAIVDPKRVKRILANRQSAARSRELKLRYIAELEHMVQTLQTEATILSAQLILFKRNNAGLTTQNNELRFRLQAMEQQAQLRDEFRLETLPSHLKDSILISVNDKHARKAWKDLKHEIGVSGIPIAKAQYPSNISPPGYLQLKQDLGQWIYDNYNSLTLVKMLDLELPFNVESYDVDRTENALVELSNLTHLYLQRASTSGLQLQQLLINLAKLSNLESLDLMERDLPKCMDLPVSLRRLSIGHCSMKPLPHSITNLSNLITLELHRSESLNSLPENLNIIRLKLDWIINSLPVSLRHLEFLKYYNISCDCRKFPSCRCLEQCLTQLVNLETLSITCYTMKSLPSIGRLHNLRVLQLKDCFSLKQLPSDLDELIGLNTLDISGTRIKSLPDSIMELPNLECVILPKCFGQESNLRNLQGFTIDDKNEIYYKQMNYYDRDYGSVSEEQVLKESEQGVAVETGSQFNDGTDVSVDNQMSDCTLPLENDKEISPFDSSDFRRSECCGDLENRQIMNPQIDIKKGKPQKIIITQEEIQLLISKKLRLVDAAEELQVSRSTLKRRLKELGMKWPSSKKGKQNLDSKKRKLNYETLSRSNSSEQMVNSSNATNYENLMVQLDNLNINPSPEYAKDIDMTTEGHKDDHPIEKQLDRPNEGTLPNIVQRDESLNPFTVKATYDDDTVKFEFSLTNTMEQLKQEVGRRLDLEEGTFRIKYDDEDNELIRMSSISEFKYPLRLARSAGLNCVRLSIIDERSRNRAQKRRRASKENREELVLTTKGEKFNQDSKNTFFFQEDLVPCILSFIQRYNDVKDDGNCGFRSVSVFVYGDEEKWLDVRRDLKEELSTHKELYKKALGGEEGFEMACRIVDWHESPAPYEHWYEAMHLGLVLATKYQKVCTHWSKQSPATFLPLETRSINQPPTEYINMALVRGNHLIALHMSTCNIPLPRLSPLWEPHCNPGVKDWFLFQFKEQFDHYNRLCNLS